MKKVGITIGVGSFVKVLVTRSYIMHCRALPLPFGVILLRYTLVATPGVKLTGQYG
jgi:hypothetical protein